MTNSMTRRELARRAVAGAAGALLMTVPRHPADAQVVDPAPAIPPLPLPAAPMPASPASAEGAALISLVPSVAGYALTPTQSREVALQLKDYPSPFAAVRAYAIPDDIGPAFAADAPMRKERVK